MTGKTEQSPAHKTALYGMLIALAFVLSFVETLIPISLGVPGVKLGLANLVTVVGLYTVGIYGTVAVSMIRIVLVAFTFGNVFSMLYSLGGWGLSILLMILCKKREWFIFQHFRHINAFPGSVQAGGAHQVHFTAFNLRGESHQVVCRV